MSKEIKPQQIALRIVLVILMGALMVRPSAIVAQQPQTAVVSPKSAAVMATTDEVLRETSEIRQLSVLRPVKSGAQSRTEIEKFLIRNLDEDTKPEEMRASELALKKLGLAPADFQYRSFIIKLLTEQVAGYYDPKTQEFYLADWIDLDGQKPVMAHELTHALQDQHFNLRRFEKWPKGDSDAELAAHALVEGDATFTMTRYVMRNPLRALAMLKSMGVSGSSMEQIERAPRALRESLLFPYEHGTVWVSHVFKQGGWAGISQTYTDLPQSTEQILHPEKYFAREKPIKINMPDISSALGMNWKRIDYDVNGEWSFYLILDEYLKSENESKKAVAGWGGDRYALYEEPRTGSVLVAQLTVWDTENDAREFFDAYAKRTPLRYKNATVLEKQTDDPALGRRMWVTNEWSIIIERRGSRVLILEGILEKADANKLIGAIWQEKPQAAIASPVSAKAQ